MPSEALMRQVADVRVGLPRAISDANAWLARARTVSATLRTHNVTLNVPPAR
jgi:hypothetical protein